MTVKIYGAVQAECTQRIVMVCYELNIPFELVFVDLPHFEHKKPEWINNMQPFGQIPVLDEDGFRMHESRAICRYLTEKFGDGKLLPRELKERGKFEQAASVEQGYFNTPAHIIVRERLFKSVMKLPIDEEQANEAEKTLRSNLQGYERTLSKQKYLAGDELTLADLFHLPIGTIIGKVGIDALTSQDTPNVARWWNEIFSRPSWQAVLADLEKAGPFKFD
ncbi:glutathione S-transferase [Fomitiporia mediterranea MF3/22]|uniref:glutathione S-transferase n=1 Tax=Fomitiporia mediterranea (strain MF3/22) TaxID=694068 RepID=UPI000440739E|nr:glutathione S-transferase [Fomitiporia mediterranea MF3/22]EJD00516.1 glutathione S-transferase [Fomitiporia mediterranea MF3/22]